ncbi:MAG: hypothetical protein AAFX09_10610 [Pseudomonadota bacterium]
MRRSPSHASQPHDRPAQQPGWQKKNAVIEARLPDRLKTRFADLVRGEDRTVSDVLREMIEAYVRRRETGRASWRLCRAERQSDRIGWAGAGALASALVAAMAVGMLTPASAEAEDVSLSYFMEISDANIAQGQVGLAFGETVAAPLTQVGEDELGFEVTAQDCTPDAGPHCEPGRVILEFEVFRHVSGEREVISSPTLIVAYDQLASMAVGSQAGGLFRLVLTPTRASDG